MIDLIFGSQSTSVRRRILFINYFVRTFVTAIVFLYSSISLSAGSIAYDNCVRQSLMLNSSTDLEAIKGHCSSGNFDESFFHSSMGRSNAPKVHHRVIFHCERQVSSILNGEKHDDLSELCRIGEVVDAIGLAFERQLEAIGRYEADG